MDYSELLQFLETHWHKTTLGRPVDHFPFAELRALLARLGSPEQGGEFVGVTGSKGKGSIAQLTATILQHHGLRVGLFTSPHLIRVEERVQVDGRPLEPEGFAARFSAALAEQRSAGLEVLGITPVILALALRYFRDAGVDVAVLEVRTGGRFDPTNIVDSSAVCVGPIGLEHVPGLGYTLAEIAWQKVGLVRPGATCFSAAQPPEAEAVLSAECTRQRSRLYRAGHELRYRVHARTERSQRIELRTPGAHFPELTLGLLGEHQAANAVLAASAAEHVLGRRGRSLQHASLAAALENASWSGRLERLSDSPLVLYDGAHTPESSAALARALADHFPTRGWTVVLGILGGKNAADLLAALAPVAARILCVPVPGFRYQEPEHLAQLARQQGIPADPANSLDQALDHAACWTYPICITGTLYLYEAAVHALTTSRESTAGSAHQPAAGALPANRSGGSDGGGPSADA